LLTARANSLFGWEATGGGTPPPLGWHSGQPLQGRRRSKQRPHIVSRLHPSSLIPGKEPLACPA